MPFVTCLACLAGCDVAADRPLPDIAHKPGCPVLQGARWECSCEGYYCSPDCNGGYVLRGAPDFVVWHDSLDFPHAWGDTLELLHEFLTVNGVDNSIDGLGWVAISCDGTSNEKLSELLGS